MFCYSSVLNAPFVTFVIEKKKKNVKTQYFVLNFLTLCKRHNNQLICVVIQICIVLQNCLKYTRD